MTTLDEQIAAECQAIAGLLDTQHRKIVLAESCTAGLVSASLAAVPGISKHFCGSAVTYREATKTAWLEIAEDDIATHTAVSAVVAAKMAQGVLRITPEANIAASITGHLGPDAPMEQDGLVYVAMAGRGDESEIDATFEHRLHESGRADRQREATLYVLRHLHLQLAVAKPEDRGPGGDSQGIGLW